VGYEFELDGHVATVWPVHGREDASLSIDGVSHAADLLAQAAGRFELELDGQMYAIQMARHGDDVFVHVEGRVHRVRVVDALARARRDAAPEGAAEILRAPMPGVVIAVDVLAGAVVETGERLMTIESMKLQTLIRAPHAARIAEVLAGPGASFDQGDPLLRLAPVGDAEEGSR